MLRTRRSRTLVTATAVLLSLAAAGCSKSAGGSDASSSAGTKAAAPVALAGSVTFNQTNLAKLDAALKSALAGKDLSKVDIAMVVNVAADYWKAGQVGSRAAPTSASRRASAPTSPRPAAS